jgi:hypothetical protein
MTAASAKGGAAGQIGHVYLLYTPRARLGG